jgi:hypothetical protein
MLDLAPDATHVVGIRQSSRGTAMFGNDGRARLAVFLLAFGFALGVPGPKLYKMALIKGWMAGAIVTDRVITQMGVERADLVLGEASYWVSWETGEVCDSWENRERVPPEVWEAMRIGGPIEVVQRFPAVRTFAMVCSLSRATLSSIWCCW